MMKKVFVLFALFLVASLAAQEETLVGEGMHSGGYGGPVWKLTTINGKIASLSGGRGAWLINHRFGIGGGGYSTITDVKSDFIEGQKPLFIALDYGGFELEYIHQSDKLLHWTAHAFFGKGTVELEYHAPEKDFLSDGIYLIEPSLNADVNLAKWFRIGVGVSYRVVMGLELEPLTQADISGFSGLIILKFGSF